MGNWECVMGKRDVPRSESTMPRKLYAGGYDFQLQYIALFRALYV